MIPLAEAQRFVLGLCDPLPPVEVALDDALGCVVAATVTATEQIPPFANSSMDGYALRAVDTTKAPVVLDVIGSIVAGSRLDLTVSAGQAARIMTGAPLPKGADAVCMVEETERADDGRRVVVKRPLRAGDYVRYPGRDVAVGDRIAQCSTMLTAAHIGVLANQGVASLLVHPRPRVGVLSTGDELFEGEGPLPHGKIRDANRHTLMALVRREGWGFTDLGVVGDDESALVDSFGSAGSTCDGIVTSGGVSVGDLDLVKTVLAKLCAGNMDWMQVAIRPAKPFAFGVLADTGTPVFGLPGNPVSAMVSFELFVRPALRLMSGHRVLDRPVVRACTEVHLPRQPDGKLHLLRAWLRVDRLGRLCVSTTRGQESHQLQSMSGANALILLPDGNGAGAGEQVQVLLIDPDQLSSDASVAVTTSERQDRQ
jgi:molybdopterin molybdotransferase